MPHSVEQPGDERLPLPLRAWLYQLRAVLSGDGPHGPRMTVIGVREGLDTVTRRFVTDIPSIPLIRDEVVAAPHYPVPVRVYHPAPEQARPVALFLHGGGHAAGSVGLYDGIARKLALATGRVLVSVEYRLAPECPYPAGLQDALSAAKRVFRVLTALGLRFEPRLALIGDSGGGALAATIAHRAQFDPALAVQWLVLIYPSLDYTLREPSSFSNGTGYFLERSRIIWLFDAYLQNAEDRRAVSPRFMPITPEFPPTLVLTPEFDPLHDEGVAYVQALQGAGVPAEHLELPGLIHAYLNLEDLVPDDCRRSYAAIGAFLAAEGT